MARKKTKMRARSLKGTGATAIMVVVFAMIVFIILFQSQDLKTRKAELQKEATYLEQQIHEQEKRSEEIAEYSKYVQTKQYVEDMARTRLGLVYKDEIIFETDD